VTPEARRTRLIRAIKIAIWSVVAFLVVAQLWRPARENPPEREGRTWESKVRFPPEVKAILERSCLDCHSHKTRWPWYSEFAPASWLVAGDVREARKKLNFSELPGPNEKYDTIGRLCHKLEEIEEEVEEGAMPLWEYKLLHPEASLSDAEIKVISEWVTAERARLALDSARRNSEVSTDSEP
jgi:hypothetical protein